jgi:large subunit ribosomal protein L15
VKLNELSPSPGSTKPKRRLGRGIGSGKGKTAGRGQKGQKSRSGVSISGFEGGQMPFYRRLPKRGFNNIFRKKFEVVNTGRLQKAVDDGKLDAKAKVDTAALKAAGLVRGNGDGVRILAKGAISAALQIDAAGASKAAIEAVEKAGGKITLPPAPEKPAKSGKKQAKGTKGAAKTDGDGAGEETGGGEDS